jgi:hypothetical protein
MFISSSCHIVVVIVEIKILVIIEATGILTNGLSRISGNNTRKAFNGFSTKDSHTRNIKHNKERAAI